MVATLGEATDQEEGLVAGNHPLQHGDDSRALLGPGRALDAELLVRALQLVEQVGAEDGRQVQGCHFVPRDLWGKKVERKLKGEYFQSSSPFWQEEP